MSELSKSDPWQIATTEAKSDEQIAQSLIDTGDFPALPDTWSMQPAVEATITANRKDQRKQVSSRAFESSTSTKVSRNMGVSHEDPDDDNIGWKSFGAELTDKPANKSWKSVYHDIVNDRVESWNKVPAAEIISDAENIYPVSSVSALLPERPSNLHSALKVRQSSTRLPAQLSARICETRTPAVHRNGSVMKRKLDVAATFKQRFGKYLKVTAIVTLGLLAAQVLMFLCLGELPDTAGGSTATTAKAPGSTPQQNKPIQIASRLVRKKVSRPRTTSTATAAEPEPEQERVYVQFDDATPRHAYQSW